MISWVVNLKRSKFKKVLTPSRLLIMEPIIMGRVKAKNNMAIRKSWRWLISGLRNISWSNQSWFVVLKGFICLRTFPMLVETSLESIWNNLNMLILMGAIKVFWSVEKLLRDYSSCDYNLRCPLRVGGIGIARYRIGNWRWWE